MELNELKNFLNRIQKEKGTQWYDTLTERKRKESEFHDDTRDLKIRGSLSDDEYQIRHGNRKFYDIIGPQKEYINNWRQKRMPGKVFLDYACGNGREAIKAAKAGSALSIGIDISDVSINNAKKRAIEEGVSEKCVFIQSDCENTGLPDESIDVILCSGMLHHLDLSYAFPELRRILKTGGHILAVEALNYNPIFKLYRVSTPEQRTEWEKAHILSNKDIRFAERFFEISDIRFWHLMVLFAVFLPKSKITDLVEDFLHGIDNLLMRIPYIKWLGWQFTFELGKK